MGRHKLLLHTQHTLTIPSECLNMYQIYVTTVSIYDYSLRFNIHSHQHKSRDSSVSIALGQGLDNWVSRVRFLAGAGNFFHQCIQNGSGAHPASYPMGTRGSFPGGKAVGA
jgi:hypothetical protein